MSTIPQKLLSLGQIFVFYGSCFLFFLLSLMRFSYPFLGGIKIHFFMMVLFYWALNRPNSLPLLLTFFIGIAVDLIEGGPVGLNGLLFFGLQWLVIDQRKFLLGQSFFMIWLGFALVLSLYALIQSLFFSLIYFDIFISPNLWAGVGLSVLLFPVVHSLLHFIHRIITYKHVESRFRLGD